MVSTLAECLALDFTRIQFTPDLMPSDITGTEVLQEDRATGARQLRYVRGPVFTNVLLADEINRTPPKTQAALLEAMQERQVSAGGHRHALPDPFFVLATQNPIEQEGTYPLPEAQLDRFLFKVFVGYPTPDEERQIYRVTTGVEKHELTKVLTGDGDSRAASARAARAGFRPLPRLRDGTWCAPRAPAKKTSRPTSTSGSPGAPVRGRARRWCWPPRPGPRWTAARAVTIEDIRAVAHPVLRHRLVTTYAAQAEGQTPDT